MKHIFKVLLKYHKYIYLNESSRPTFWLTQNESNFPLWITTIKDNSISLEDLKKGIYIILYLKKGIYY